MWPLQADVESARPSLGHGVREDDRGAEEHVGIGNLDDAPLPECGIDPQVAREAVFDSALERPLTLGLDVSATLIAILRER